MSEVKEKIVPVWGVRRPPAVDSGMHHMEEVTWNVNTETLGPFVHVLPLFLDHDPLLPWEGGP